MSHDPPTPCTCHRSLAWWVREAWRGRASLPFLVGVTAGLRLWAVNRKDRHT